MLGFDIVPFMIVIRKATRADAVVAWRIRQDAVLSQCGRDYPEGLLRGWTDGSPSENWHKMVERSFYVATDGDAVIATGMLTLETGQIDAIFVLPLHMSCGIGRAMLIFLEKLAHKGGLSSLRLESTLTAAPFYRRCGWIGDAQSIHRSPRGFDLACIPMTKQLEHVMAGG